MTKTEIIKAVSLKQDVSLKEAAKYVNYTLGAIGDALATGQEVILADFGKFSVKTVPEHKAINPQTRETITVPQKQKVVFKPYENITSYSFNNR